jgi:hypothetical protein
MNTWLKSYGKLYVGDDVVRIVVSDDFIRYYKNLVDKQVRLFTHSPAHGAHISIHNPKIHGKLLPQQKKFLKDAYGGRKISFEYDLNIIEGGKTKKTFRNWYMNVKSITGEAICKYLKNNMGKGMHITICNTKGGERPYIWMKKTM